MANLDTLEIQIKADATDASKSIDRLCTSIGKLKTSLGSVDTKGMQKFSSGMSLFNTSMQGLSKLKLPDFTRTAKGIQKFADIDGRKLSVVANNLNPLASSLSAFSTAMNGASFNNKGVISLINSVTRLSNSTTGNLASINFDNLGNGLVSFSNKLMNASKVSTNTIQMTNAIARLANAGGKAPIVSAELGRLGISLKKFMSIMHGSRSVSQETIQFTSALGMLASAGIRTKTTADNLSHLSTELKNFFTTMSSAPRISQNTIQMTDALARLAQASSGVNRASRSLNGAFGGMSGGIGKTKKGFKGLAYTFGKFYATCWMLVRALKYVKESIDISSQLTELQNVVVHTFAQDEKALNKFADTAITDFGMSELYAKKFATRFQSMGQAMELSSYITEDAMSKTNSITEKFGNGLYSSTSKMSDMSINLTKLTADMASFYDVSQDVVAEDMEAIFTGQTKPLRKYGIDLTQATLKEWALKNGLDADVRSMSQAEKTLLRYQYVMSNTKEVMGDFQRTQNTWHNQLTILKALFQNLGKTVGTAFVNMLSPMIRTFNTALLKINEFAEKVVNSLGKIFGWKIEISSGSLADDFEDAADGADDLADGTGKAADNAKKLKQQLQGFDELNVLTSNKDDGSGGKSGSGSDTSGSGASGTDSAIKVTNIKGEFESQLDTLEKLGDYIGTKLKNALLGIKWDEVYEGAKNFGTGLADFLNGLFNKDEGGNSVFSALGTTIAGLLNTVLNAVFSFSDTFNWDNFGTTLADGINSFFDTFDFKLAADTIVNLKNGIKSAFKSFFDELKPSDIISGITDFTMSLDMETIAISIGAVSWMMGGKKLAAEALKNLLAKDVAITSLATSGSVPASVAVGLSIATAIVGFKIGTWLYENVDSIQKFSDGVVAWIMKDGEEVAIAKTISVALTGLAIALPIAKIAGVAIASAKAGTLTTALYVWATDTALPALATFFGTTLPALLPVAGYAVAIAVAVTVGLHIGKKWYEKATGEEAQGGLKDLVTELFSGETTWTEIGDAISDGAVVDITLTPLLRWISGDDTITTDEVIQAGADMIDDVISGITNLPKKISDKALDIKANIDATVSDSFKTVEKFFSDTADTTKNFIAQGIGKAKDVFKKITDSFSNTSDTIKNFVANAKGKTESSFNSLYKKFKAFSDKLATVTADAKDVSKGVLNSLKSTWSSIKSKTSILTGKAVNKTSSVLSTLKDAWGSIYTKTATLTATFKDNFSAAFKAIFNGLVRGLNKVIGVINKIPNVNLSLLSELKAEGGTYYNGKWHDISQYASGGVPQHGTLAYVGEAGPEILGHVGGRTEVLNESQLASVMFEAVSSAMAQNSKSSNVTVTLEGDAKQLFRMTQEEASDYFRRTGRPAYQI